MPTPFVSPWHDPLPAGMVVTYEDRAGVRKYTSPGYPEYRLLPDLVAAWKRSNGGGAASPEPGSGISEVAALTTGAGRLSETTMRSRWLAKWQPQTTYALGEAVLSPQNAVVAAKAAHTSGASYVASDWVITSATVTIVGGGTGGGGGVATGFSGAYADLSGKPSLFSGVYADLSGKPSLFSGNYADLNGKPTIPAPTTSASDLSSGILPLARIADGTLPIAKLNVDIATQAELDTVSGIANGKYTKPGTGIPETDLASAVQTKLNAVGGGSGGITQAQVGSYWTVTKRPVEISGLVAGADNTSAINTAITNASEYDTLVFPRGDWTHAASLVHGKKNLTVEGYGARLIGTVPRYGGYRVTADGARVRGLAHEVVGATARGNGENYDDCPFSAWDVSDVVFEDIESLGSRDAQFFLGGVTGARLRNLVGRQSFADGLHISGGSRDVTADQVSITNAGDDGVAVVSYTNDARLCSNVRVSGISVVNSLARGVSIVGGTQIRYTDFKVMRSRGAGVYIAHEQGDFNTSPVTDAFVSGGDLTECNWDSGLDSGAIGLFNLVAGTVMRRAIVTGMVVREMRKSNTGAPYALVKNSGGTGGKFQGCVYQDIDLLGGTARGEVYADGISNARIAATGSNYQNYQGGTGTGVTQNSEGYVAYGSNGLAESTTTAAAPAMSVIRVRSGALYSTI